MTTVAWQAELSHPMSLKPQGSFDRPKAAGRVMGAVSRASLGQPASVERLEGLAEAVSTGWMLRAGQLAEISLASVGAEAPGLRLGFSATRASLVH